MYLRLDQWNYWKLASKNTTSWAEGYTTFNWRFRTEADDVFAIKITATVKFGIYAAGYWTIYHTANPSIVISLANYWQ